MALGVGAGLLGLGALNYLGGRSQADATNKAEQARVAEERRAAAMRDKLLMGGRRSGLGDEYGRWDVESGTFKDTLTPGTKDLMKAQRERATTGELAGTMGNRAAMGPGGFADLQLASLPSIHQDAAAQAQLDRTNTEKAFVGPAVKALMAQMQRTYGGTSNQAPSVYEGIQPLEAQLNLGLGQRTNEYMAAALSREKAKIDNLNALINQGSFNPDPSVTAGQASQIAQMAGQPIQTQRPDAGAGLGANTLADVIAAAMANTRRKETFDASKQQTKALIEAIYANRGLGNKINFATG